MEPRTAGSIGVCQTLSSPHGIEGLAPETTNNGHAGTSDVVTIKCTSSIRKSTFGTPKLVHYSEVASLFVASTLFHYSGCRECDRGVGCC